MSAGDPNRTPEELWEAYKKARAENEAATEKRNQVMFAEAKKRWAGMTADEKIFARMDAGMNAWLSRRGPHYNRSRRTLDSEDYVMEGN